MKKNGTKLADIFMCNRLPDFCTTFSHWGLKVSESAQWRRKHIVSGRGGARLIKNLGKQNRKRALNMVMCNFAKKGLPPPPAPPFPCSDAYAVTTGHILPRLVNIRLYR